MNFGNYLESCVRKKDISINALSKICGINRGGLYSIFKNERKLKEDKLFDIIRAAGLNCAEEEKLVHLFFCDYFGESEFRRIESLLYEIQQIGKEQPCEQPETLPFEKKEILMGEAEIYSALKHLINTNESVTTNFSCDNRIIDQLFYRAVCSGRLQDLCHIITLSEEGDEVRNYKTIFSSFKYMYARSFPYYQWSSVGKLTELISFPNFAIGSDCAVLFDHNWGIFIEEEKAVLNLKKKAEALLNQCSKLGGTVQNMMDVKQIYQMSCFDRGKVVSFQGYLCIAPFIDYPFIQSVVREEIPQHELLAKIAYEHYHSIFNTIDFLEFATIDGLTRFAETGNVAEASGDLVRSAEIPYRIEILRNISRAVEEDRFFIFDDQKFYMPRNLAIEKYTSRMMFDGFDSSVPDFSQTDQFFAEFSDISLMQTFDRAADYLIRSRKVHSKEFTLRLIDELILKLSDRVSKEF